MTPYTVLVTLLICLTYQAMGKELHPSLTTRPWPHVAESTTIPSSRSYFSSRLEYSNKWLPVGRDPMKNDPTFDYSPPAIDHRIRYWDEKASKTNGNKNEILLLGVSSRRPYNHHFDRRLSDIPTVMLPPPIQSMQTLNFKNEKNSNSQSLFGIHKKWQDKLADSVPAESNIQPTILMTNTGPTVYQKQSDLNLAEVKLSPDFHSSMYTKSIQSKKPWLQDLLRKEVARPTMPSHVHMEKISLLKLDDINQFNNKITVESMTEIAPPYFVPTIHPSISNDNKALYKELQKPMNPMSLIIQGHSRVKTYGQGTDERDPKIIEVKSVEDPVVNRVVSKDENGVQFDVKHLHTNNKTENYTFDTAIDSERKNSTVAGLLSLLDLSFGDFLDNSSDVVHETKINEIKIL